MRMGSEDVSEHNMIGVIYIEPFLFGSSSHGTSHMVQSLNARSGLISGRVLPLLSALLNLKILLTFLSIRLAS